MEDSVCVGMQGRVSDEPAGDLRHRGVPGHFSRVVTEVGVKRK